MNTVTAFTEVDYPEEAYYPGVVSITEKDGTVEVSVRETGSQEFISVQMPMDEFHRMLVESVEYLDDKRESKEQK